MKAVVFDMDDTLVNSREAHLLSIKDVLLEFELEPKLEEITKHFGLKFTEIIRVVYGIKDEELLNRMNEAKKMYFLKYLDKVKLMPYAKYCLRKLHGRVKLALASMSQDSVMKRIVDYLEIESFFDALIGGDRFPSKPDPALYKAAVEKLEVKPTDTYFVDDSIYGILAAHKLGAKVISIPTGSFTYEELLKYKPDFIVRSLKEIPSLVL